MPGGKWSGSKGPENADEALSAEPVPTLLSDRQASPKPADHSEVDKAKSVIVAVVAVAFALATTGMAVAFFFSWIPDWLGASYFIVVWVLPAGWIWFGRSRNATT